MYFPPPPKYDYLTPAVKRGVRFTRLATGPLQVVFVPELDASLNCWSTRTAPYGFGAAAHRSTNMAFNNDGSLHTFDSAPDQAVAEVIQALPKKKRGVKAGSKRGPYKQRQTTADNLDRFRPELLRAFVMSLNTDGLVLPKGSFYRLDQIKQRFGNAAVKEFRRFFVAKQDGYNTERAQRIEQMYKEGRINDLFRKKLLVRCVEWRWRMKFVMSIEARNLLDAQLAKK